MFFKFNVSDMRALHFEKLLPQYENRTEKQVTENRRKNDRRRVYQRFCCLGYYDQMSYVRAEDEEAILDYKHCFLIKYPYRKNESRMVTDQMFTLLSEEEPDGNKFLEIDEERDPFEVDEAKEIPFLGIILLTVGKNPGSAGKEPGGSVYQELLQEYKKACTSIVEQVMASSEQGCYRIFYTPNCADLCIALRTDKLQSIYDVKEQLTAKKLDQIKGSVCHTSSYTLFQLPGKAWSDALIEKNKDLWLELRIYAPEYVMKKIMESLTGESRENGNVYGITGSGQYALELDFETFASIYPSVWKIKAGAGGNSVQCVEMKSELQRIFNDHASVLECSYMRVKYQPHISEHESGSDENMNGLCLTDTELVEKYENEIMKFVKENNPKGGYQANSLKEQKIMLRELYYTYNDFWFRQSSSWKGVVFYAQLESIMNGVRQYEGLAEQLHRNQEKLISHTCRELEQAIFSVNNFNKLLQSVNQYVVNIPNYEMQTKVNIEKYLMAYTMYLFEISNNYYQEQRGKDTDRILPFFMLDFNASNIEALMLFGRKTLMPDDGERYEEKNGSDSKTWTALLAVRCPNYQWFANVYHVLPTITHEMSHNLCYEPRVKRNKFLFDYIITSLSMYMMEQSLEYAGVSCEKMYYGNRELFFLRHIEDSLLEELNEYIRLHSDRMRLEDLGGYLCNEFLRMIGLQELYDRTAQTKGLIYKEILNIFHITGMSYMGPEEVQCNCWKKDELKAMELCYNLLLDLLEPGKGIGRSEEWADAIEKVDQAGMCENSKTILKWMKDILLHFKKEGIPEMYIRYISSQLIRVWERNDERLRKLKETDENIRRAIEALERMDVKIAHSFVNRSVSDYNEKERQKKVQGENRYHNIAVDDQTEYYEKLSGYVYSYGNIRAQLLTKKLKYISSTPDIDPAKVFAEKLHRRLHEGYKEMLKYRYNASQWITFKENQKFLTSLGVISGVPEQFRDNYERVLRGLSGSRVRSIIHDQIQLYEEVFADYGMCKAFSFTAYGYFMYCIHITMKKRDVPKKGLNNSTADRIRTLLLSLYKKEVEEGTFEEQLQEYWEDLKAALTIHRDELPEGYAVLCKVDNFRELNQGDFDQFVADYENGFAKGEAIKGQRQDRELYKQIWIVRWITLLYRNLYIDDELDGETDELTVKLCNHVCEVDEKVEQNLEGGAGLWIRKCREDKNLQDIGDYYNHYQYSSMIKDTKEGRCMKHQNQFVFEYYQKMFDCIQSVKAELDRTKGGCKEILDILFEYRFDSSLKTGEGE